MSFQEQWGSATVNDSDKSSPPEPGTYEVALDDARAFTAKSGTDWFVVAFRVVTGQGIGHQWSVLANLAKDGGVAAAKSMSAKLGVPIDEVNCLEDLDRLAKLQVGGYYAVDVVQKGDFRNTYIRERVTGETPASDVPASDVPVPDAVGAGFAAVDDDDIPFAPSIV